VSILPIGSLPVTSLTSDLSALSGAAGSEAAGGGQAASSAFAAPAGTPAPTGSSGFGDLLTNALSGVESTQNTADQMSQLAATGDLSNVHDLTIATSEAQVATQLTAAVANKAVAAFNSIVGMQV
jgi:flagellar hook-basal body complex protein FliE